MQITYADTPARKVHLDTMRITTSTVRPRILENAMKIFSDLSRRVSRGEPFAGSAPDPMRLVLQVLPAVFALKPQLLLRILTDPDVRHLFVDTPPLEAKEIQDANRT